MRPQLFVAIGFIGSLTVGCQQDDTSPTGVEAESPSIALAKASAAGWVTRPDYPQNLYDAASVSITNSSTLHSIVYVIGGIPKPGGAPGSISSAVKAYDVTKKAWSSKAAYPVRIRGTNGAVEINGKIYVSGGFTRRLDEKRSVYRLEDLQTLYAYDPTTNKWTRRSDMPIRTVNGVSAAYNGLLYVVTSCYESAFCGQEFNLGALWRYNPSTDRWVFLGRTPHDPWRAAGGFVGGKLYVVEELGATDVYDVGTNTWSTGPQRPFRLCTAAATTFAAKLYLVGCHDDDDNSGDWPMLVYDPSANAWTQAATPPRAPAGEKLLSRIVVNGKPGLELVGGAKPGNNLQYVP